MPVSPNSPKFIVAATLFALLAACGSNPPAPVLERSGARSGMDQGSTPPGFYRVKHGDTLYRIALEFGQPYREIAAWNNLAIASQIEVGQLLRVVPPGADPTAKVGAEAPTEVVVALPPAVEVRPVTNGIEVSPPPVAVVPPLSASASSPVAAIPPPKPPVAAPDVLPPGAPSFVWPGVGETIGTFDGVSNKGVDIAGKKGDPVIAAADGRVIYAGNLRAYGNLIIIKHDSTFITAYAHNDAILVAENAAVKKGQKIAEMGSSEADRVKLHFEVRRDSKPVDPLGYLPPR